MPAFFPAVFRVRWRRDNANFSVFVLSIAMRGTGAILALSLNVLLARLLGASEYGRYMTWLSAGLVLGGFAVFGVDQVLTRELAGRASANWKLRHKLVGWAAARVICSAMAAAIIYVLWAVFFQSGLPLGMGAWLGVVAGVGLVLLFALGTVEAGAINGFSASLRSQALLLVVKNVVTLALLGILYWFIAGPRQAVQALWLQVGGYLITGSIGAYWLRGLFRHALDTEADNDTRGLSRRWSIASRHFLMVSLAALLVNRLDVVLVSALSDPQVAGIYAAGARVAQLALVAALAINVVLSPRIARAYRFGDRRALRRLFRKGLALTAPIAAIEIVVAIMLGSRIVAMFGASYAGAAAPFTWVTIGYALWTLAAPGYALLAMSGFEEVVAALSWLVVVANVGTIAVLVPLYGAAGGGVAMAAGYGLSLVALYAVLARVKGKIPGRGSHSSGGGSSG